MSSSLVPSLVPASCERQRSTQERSDGLCQIIAVATHDIKKEDPALCPNSQLHTDNNNSILNTTALSVDGATACTASGDVQLVSCIALPCLPYLASCESEAATPVMNTTVVKALEDGCKVVAQQAPLVDTFTDVVRESEVHMTKCHAMTPTPSERNPHRSLAPPSPSSKIQERTGHVSLVRTRSRALKSSSSSRSPPPHPQGSAPRVLLATAVTTAINDGHILSSASNSKGPALSAQRASRARARTASSASHKRKGTLSPSSATARGGGEGDAINFSYRSAARSPAHVRGGDGVDVDHRVAKKSRSEHGMSSSTSLYRAHSEEKEATAGSKIGNKTDDVSPLPRPSRGSILFEADRMYLGDAPANDSDNDDLTNEEGRQLFQQQRGQLSQSSTSASAQRFPTILSVPPPLPISNPQTPPMPRALFVACKLCGLSSPFCAQNGKPHVPVAPCIKCGLSTAFCPLTGGAHDVTVASATTVLSSARLTSDGKAREGLSAVDRAAADVELSIAAGGVGVPSALPSSMSHYVPASTLSASLARRSGTVGPSTCTSEPSTSDKRRSVGESEVNVSSTVVTEGNMMPDEFLGTAADPHKATVAQPPPAMHTSTARRGAAVSAPPRAAGVGVLSRTKAKALLGVEGGALVSPTHTDPIAARKAIAAGSAKLSSALRKPLSLPERSAKAPAHSTAAANVVMAAAKKGEQGQSPSSTLTTVGSARTASKSSHSLLPVTHSVTPRVAGLATIASEARRAEAAAKRSAAVSAPAAASSCPRGAGGIGPKSSPSLSSKRMVTPPPPRPANSPTHQGCSSLPLPFDSNKSKQDEDFTKATPTPPTRALPQKVPLAASVFSQVRVPVTSRSQHLSTPSQTPPGQHVAVPLTATKKMGDTATQKTSSKLASHPNESPPLPKSSSIVVVPADQHALTTSVIDSEALTLAEYATTMMGMWEEDSDVEERSEAEGEEERVVNKGEREVVISDATDNPSTCTTTLPLSSGSDSANVGVVKASSDDVGNRRVVLKPAKSLLSTPKAQMSEGILQLTNRSGQDDEASVAVPKTTKSQTIGRTPTISSTPKTQSNSSTKPKRPALPSCAACLKVIRPPKASPSSENSFPAVGAAEGRISTPNITDDASATAGTASCSSTARGIERAPPSLKHVVSCSVCHRHYHTRCFLENAGTAAAANTKNTGSPLLLQSKSSTDRDIFEGEGSAFDEIVAKGLAGEQLAAVPPAVWLSYAHSFSVCQVCLSDVVRIDGLLSNMDSERSSADGGDTGIGVGRTETLLSNIITGQAPATTPAHHLIQLLINGYTSIPLLHQRGGENGCSSEEGECVAGGSSGTYGGDDHINNQEGEEHNAPRDDKQQQQQRPHDEDNTTTTSSSNGKEVSLEASLARLKSMAERLYKSLMMSHEMRADNYPNSTPSLESGYSNFRMRGEGRYEMVAPFFLETLSPIITNEANCGIMSVLRSALNTGGQGRGSGGNAPPPPTTHKYSACATSANTYKEESNVCLAEEGHEEDAATATGISTVNDLRSSGETTAALINEAINESTDNAGEAEDELAKKRVAVAPPEKVLLSILRSVPLRPMSSGCFYSTCGSEHQNWHTDGPSLLGGEGEGVSEENHHHQPDVEFGEVLSITEGGQTLLPYAINVFVPLVPMNNKNGTEFVPGSHLSSKVKAMLKAALMAREGPMRVRPASTKSEAEVKEEVNEDASHGDLPVGSTATVVCNPHPCVDDSDDNANLADGASAPTASAIGEKVTSALTASVPPSFNEAQWEKHFKSKTSPTVALGNALLFDYRVEHRGLGNKAYHDRPCVYMTYAQPWYIDTYNFDGKRYAHTLELPEGWHMDRAERAARKRNENEMRTDV